jgi:hypothetical protein
MTVLTSTCLAVKVEEWKTVPNLSFMMPMRIFFKQRKYIYELATKGD